MLAFEEALDLRPSAGLHYNIAVCHHRLMLSFEPQAPDYERHRAAAVDAYNRYLEQAPQAEDRYSVAGSVAELGGRPKVLDEWRIDPDSRGAEPPPLRDETNRLDPIVQPPPPAAVEPQPGPAGPRQPETPPATEPTAPLFRPVRPGFPHGFASIGFAVDLHGIGALRDTSEVVTQPLIGPVIRVGGHLGDRRRWSIGGELQYTTQPSSTRSQHRLSTTVFSVLGEWSIGLGPAKRFDLGFGMLLGAAAQTLRHRESSTARCPVRASGVVSTRGGLTLGTRLGLGVRLGSKGRHGILLRTGPSAGFFDGSSGNSDDACDELDPPFAEFGLDSISLLFRSDVGYTFRW